MIRITCTSCKKVLTIDDAFAGGVCRCQHCGTIQTVPAILKGSAERAATAAAGAGKNAAKTLYRTDKLLPGSGSGLDELAEVVHSSGLQRGDLKRKPIAVAANNNFRNLMIFCGAILAAMVVIIIMLATRGGHPDHGGPEHFSGTIGPIKLTGDTVVYLIDDGNAAHDSLDGVKQLCYRSARTLGPDRHFLIMFWEPSAPAFPADFTTISATSEHADAAETHLADVTASGAAEVDAALKKALATNPDEIVLITPKGEYTDADWQKDVLAIRGNSAVKIDCLAISESDNQGVLPQVAAATGGKFARISAGELR